MPDDNNEKNHEFIEEEKKRIEVDILRAQKEKIEAERDEIIKRSNAKWYHNEKLIQFVVASVLTIPIIWFFFDALVQPLYLSKNELNKVKWEITKEEISKQEVEIGEKEIEAKRLKEEAVLLKQRTEKLADSVRINEKNNQILNRNLRKNEKDLNQRSDKILSLEENLSDVEIQMKNLIIVTEYEIDSLKVAAQDERIELYQQFESKNAIINKVDTYFRNVTNLEDQNLVGLIKQWNELMGPELRKVDVTSMNYITGIENDLIVGDGVNYVETSKNNVRFTEGNLRYIILNYTAGTNVEMSAKYFSDPDTQASTHLLVGRDGEIFQLVHFNIIAWHAGKSSWKNLNGMNRYSIAIEMSNAGLLSKKGESYYAWSGEMIPKENVFYDSDTDKYWEKYTEIQILSVKKICELLIEKYEIEEVLGHEEISPGRKQDPGPAWPMEDFRVASLIRE